MRNAIPAWKPLAQILALERSDGGFASTNNPADARRTFWALVLMHRCALDTSDEPVWRAIEHLHKHHGVAGALSYTTGGSGVLPCYLGVVTTALVKMGALETDVVQSSIRWLVDHQRFDHGGVRAAREIEWARSNQAMQEAADLERDEVAQRFEEVVEVLRELDVDQVWEAATFAERRVLVEELLEAVTIFPDHLKANVASAPRLNVLLSEVGLKESADCGVGGGT